MPNCKGLPFINVKLKQILKHLTSMDYSRINSQIVTDNDKKLQPLKFIIYIEANHTTYYYIYI
jgi:replication initiation and membrane attachment protein DnaB